MARNKDVKQLWYTKAKNKWEINSNAENAAKKILQEFYSKFRERERSETSDMPKNNLGRFAT